MLDSVELSCRSSTVGLVHHDRPHIGASHREEVSGVVTFDPVSAAAAVDCPQQAAGSTELEQVIPSARSQHFNVPEGVNATNNDTGFGTSNLVGGRCVATLNFVGTSSTINWN